MSQEGTHAIQGVGIRKESETTNQFNPRLFHRGMVGLQEFVLELNQNDHTRKERVSMDGSDPGHMYNRDESMIVAGSHTSLSAVLDAIPRGWDVTVVVDANDSYDGFYAVTGGLHCGGGVSIWFSVIIREHRIEELNINFTDLSDETRENEIEMNKLTLPLPPSRCAELIRLLSDTITIGYTNTISTGTRAFDYSMCCSLPKNDRGGPGNELYTITQSYWSDVRGTTRQNISDKLSEARNDLSERGIDVHADPLPSLYTSQEAALTEIDADSDEDGFVRLV